MRANGTRDWKDLIKEYKFVEHYEKFFKAYTESEHPQLNELQLKSLPEISHHDKNLLICAPTGSGKTLVFEMIMLNCIHKYYPTDYSNFKLIYVAPTRAVCEEKKKQFEDHLKLDNTQLDLKIKDMGDIIDQQNTQIFQILEQNHIIICTPEMCDYILRVHPSTIWKLSLFMVDQLHMIGCEQRGPNLEIIMEKFLSLQRYEGLETRIICVSASIPNRNQIQKWLNAVLVQSLKRPVPLKLYLPTIQCKYTNQKSFQKRTKNIIHDLFPIIQSLEKQLFSTISVDYKGAQSYLVFCRSRNDVKTNCKQFMEKLKHKNIQFSKIKCKLTLDELNKLFQKYQITNDELKKYLSKRIGYHHAHLLKNEKDLIVQLMQSGWLKVLFSTSTLAQGVNLPVKAVFLNTVVKFKNNEQQRLYFWRDIDQMVGRAGRKKADEVGYCCFLDTDQNLKKILEGTYDNQKQEFNYQAKMQSIQSNLKQNFADFLFCEAASRELNLGKPEDIEILVKHFKQSLWAQQTKKSKKSSDAEIQQFIRNYIDQKRELFRKCNLSDPKTMNKLYKQLIFSVDTYIELFNTLVTQNSQNNRSHLTHKTYLETLCYIEQISMQHRYNRNEDLLGELKRKVQVPIQCELKKQSSSRKYSRNKAMFLIQIMMMGQIGQITNLPLKLEAEQIIKIFSKVCKLVKFLYTEFPGLFDLSVVFFTEIYLKYCRDPQQPFSHMNIELCCHRAQINTRWLNSRVTERCKQIGFFEIKITFQANKRFGSLYVREEKLAQEKVKQYALTVRKQNLGKYYWLQCESNNHEMVLFVYKRYNNQYIYSHQKYNRLKFNVEDDGFYAILAIFTQEIGFDSVYVYKAGQLADMKFTNSSFDLDKLCQQFVVNQPRRMDEQEGSEIVGKKIKE